MRNGLDVDIAVASTLNWMDSIMEDVKEQVLEWLDERYIVAKDDELADLQAKEDEVRRMNIAAINMMKLDEAVNSGNGMPARDSLVLAYSTDKKFDYQDIESEVSIIENY